MANEMELCIPGRKREAAATSEEIGRAMNAFLGSISQENRVIFLRRYWFCDTIAEIAQRYGIRESKVRKQLLSTQKQWADYLKKEGVGEWAERICISE